MTSMSHGAEVKPKKPKKPKQKIRGGCLGGGGDEVVRESRAKVKRGGITRVYAQEKREPKGKKPPKTPVGQG